MRRVGLGFPPDVIARGQARMPMAQQLSATLYDQIQSTLRPRDALRITYGPRRCYGDLPSPQRFTRSVLESMGTNTPGNMQPGLRIRNAPRTIGNSNGTAAGM
jgi:hypothetical protein